MGFNLYKLNITRISLMDSETIIFRTFIYTSPSSIPYKNEFTKLNDARIYINIEFNDNENTKNIWMYEIQQVNTIYNKKNKTISETHLIIERHLNIQYSSS